MTNSPSAKNTPAFYLMAILSFGIALAVVVIGELYLPVPAWTRAFLALGTVFLVSATFTLAKCVRDQQENEAVISRIDAARLERMLAAYDPYQTNPVDPYRPVPVDNPSATAPTFPQPSQYQPAAAS